MQQRPYFMRTYYMLGELFTFSQGAVDKGSSYDSSSVSWGGLENPWMGRR